MIAEFQKIEDALNTSYELNDVKTIATFLADDWIMLESSTGISDRKQFLQAIEEKKLTHTAMKKTVVDVKAYTDVAIVVSRGRNVGHYQNIEFNAEQWVTNIYRKSDAGWRCIMTQETPVSC